MNIKVNDVLHFKKPGVYPDIIVVAVVDNAVGMDRTDGMIEPITWYSKKNVKIMLEGDWQLRSKS